MNNLKRGFTLIELLVVIAIIGILSSVVLASLNSARDKGANAAIKSNLANMRAQAEIIYDNSLGSYATVCLNANVVNSINSAKQVSGILTPTNTGTGTGSAGTATCHDTALGWAIEVPLKTPSGWFQCVDGAGQSTTTSSFSIGGSDDVVCG